MAQRLGAEWPAFLAALETPVRTAVRLHPVKGRGLFPDTERVPWHPQGRLLDQRPSFEREPLWHAGAYYVQEASGMSLRAFLPERRPIRVLDLSAAPGGKSTLILGELGPEGGLLLANDPDPRRRTALVENLARWGTPAYLITGRHPHWWAKHFPQAFDVVLLDAPCSGEGLWRKDPRACTYWSPALPARMQRLQRSLLFAAKNLVAPGGTLIYATCTFAPEENEDNLAQVFREPTEWEPVGWADAPQAAQPVAYGEGGIGYYFYPHRGPGAGFFISAWRRRGRSPRWRTAVERPPLKPPIRLPVEVWAFPNRQEIAGLYPAAAALVPAPLLKERWEAFPLYRHQKPAHALALLEGGRLAEVFPERSLSRTEFAAYLRGEVLAPQAPIEWVTCEGAGVGWLYRGRPSLPFTWRRFLSLPQFEGEEAGSP